MSKIGLLILLLFMAASGYTQQDYFVLIQADNGQPFYVLMGEKTISSSARGHLILSRLRDSAYTLSLGFPKAAFPDQVFSFSINNKDIGFQLKNLGEKGWALFNTQTLELIMPVKKDMVESKSFLEGIKKDDAFSRLMAGVVSDTAVMYNNYSMEAYLKDSSKTGRNASVRGPDTANHVMNMPNQARDTPNLVSQTHDTAVSWSIQRSQVAVFNLPSVTSDSSKTIPAPPTLLPERKPDSSGTLPSRGKGLHKTAFIERLSEQRTGTALQLSYADHGRGRHTDTVQIIIPFDSTISSQTIQPDTARHGAGPTPLINVVAPERHRPILVNSDCRNYASDGDVNKLRLKLLPMGKDEDKIAEAKKVFRLKCFNTSQLKTLCGLFVTDAGKFSFLQTAYPFVSDDRFTDLAELMTDPVYVSKFQAMTAGR